MRSYYRRKRVIAKLTGAGALLLIVLGASSWSAVYAQEDESFNVTPAVTALPDEDASSTWEMTGEPPPEAPADSVLDLPQVVAVNHPAASDSAVHPETATPGDEIGVPAEETAGDEALDEPASEAASAAGSPADLVSYAAQGAPGGDLPPVTGPLAAPASPFPSTSAIVVYSFVVNRGTPAWWGVPAGQQSTFGSFPQTSPMLTAPRGTRVIVGGWWHRAR